jgi:alpha-galactosidase
MSNILDCYRRYVPLELPPGACFFHRNVNNLTATDYGPVVLALEGFDADHHSQDFLIAGDVESNRYVLIGAITARRSLTYLHLHLRQTRIVGVSYYQPDIAEDEEPEEIVRLEGTDWRDLLVEYAELAASRANVPASVREPASNTVGYCSWYYYYESVSQQEFMENVQGIAAARRSGDFPAQVVQIDDGYQAHQGDWLTTNERWPGSLAEVAAAIHKQGMRAGIWLMPLLASTASDVFARHPEWFVKGNDGKPWVMRGWSPPPDENWVCMDATHPEVHAHLRKVFGTLQEWGFDYFKMDGLGFMIPPGRRHDPQATGISAFRLGLQTIREAVPKATLLGCCAPFLPSLGLVDNARISADTAACWIRHRDPSGPTFEEENTAPDPESPCLANALHHGMARWWMADRWFRADPDVVIVRAERSHLTEGECRMSALEGILTGVVITSDPVASLPPARMALLKRAANLRVKNPRPVDSRPGYWPQLFEGTLEGRRAIAIFNDAPHAQEWKISALGLSAAEELLHPMGRLGETITVAAHDAALLVERGGRT